MRASLQWLPVLSVAATIGCGLIAGLLFAFSNVVMRALAALPPAHGMATMQRINVAIINPLFLAAFLGTAAACVVIAVVTAPALTVPGHAWLLGGSVLYIAGVVGVTLAFNVPLNNGLARADAASADAAWPAYVTAWLRWNHLRTALAALAVGAFAWGLFGYGGQTP